MGVIYLCPAITKATPAANDRKKTILCLSLPMNRTYKLEGRLCVTSTSTYSPSKACPNYQKAYLLFHHIDRPHRRGSVSKKNLYKLASAPMKARDWESVSAAFCGSLTQTPQWRADGSWPAFSEPRTVLEWPGTTWSMTSSRTGVSLVFRPVCH